MPPVRAAAVLLAYSALAAAGRAASAQRLAPALIPEAPKPYFSWDVIPTAFHGANKSGVYTDEAVAQLAKHQMVTIEKWYTPCASQSPTQGPPSCYVEHKIEHVLGRIKKLQPKLTGILYYNSMFNFNFYHLNGMMEAAEARGLHSFLRDETGKVISLCNDGDEYCKITTFDWTQPHVRELWMEGITNATATGAVDGIFADHSAQEHIQIGAATNGQGPNQLCNGVAHKGRTCYNFTAAFTESFNSWHLWATNKSQDLLSKSTGGPVICGPLARYGQNMCDFDELRSLHQSGIGVIEASRSATWPPTEDCLAAFLAAAQPGMYMAQLRSDPAVFSSFTEHAEQYPLGEPDGDAVEVQEGVFRRRFGPTKGRRLGSAAGAKPTEVWWDNGAKRGNITWGGGQPPPPPPPLPPPPLPPQPQPAAECGKLLRNTAVGNEPDTVRAASSVAECCRLCTANAACAKWAFHAEVLPRKCHMHDAHGLVHELAGCYSGVMNRTVGL